MSQDPAPILAPCPRCSSRFRLQRPEWAYARHTSAKRGDRFYIWTGGCRHGEEFRRDPNPVADPAVLADAAARWEAETRRQFGELTAHWTPAQRAVHASTLGIDLTPEEPAHEQQPTKEENHGQSQD